MTDSKTATERLRELLDARGVKWYETINHANCTFTWWKSPLFGEVHAMDNEDGETLFMECLNNCNFTPEQAIAATLGGKCEYKPMWDEDDPLAEEYLGMWYTGCGDALIWNADNDGCCEPPAFCPYCGGKAVKR